MVREILNLLPTLLIPLYHLNSLQSKNCIIFDKYSRFSNNIKYAHYCNKEVGLPNTLYCRFWLIFIHCFFFVATCCVISVKFVPNLANTWFKKELIYPLYPDVDPASFSSLLSDCIFVSVSSLSCPSRSLLIIKRSLYNETHVKFSEKVQILQNKSSYPKFWGADAFSFVFCTSPEESISSFASSFCSLQSHYEIVKIYSDLNERVVEITRHFRKKIQLRLHSTPTHLFPVLLTSYYLKNHL